MTNSTPVCTVMWDEDDHTGHRCCLENGHVGLHRCWCGLDYEHHHLYAPHETPEAISYVGFCSDGRPYIRNARRRELRCECGAVLEGKV